MKITGLASFQLRKIEIKGSSNTEFGVLPTTHRDVKTPQFIVEFDHWAGN
jgi:hypothetical protein